MTVCQEQSIAAYCGKLPTVVTSLDIAAKDAHYSDREA